MRCVGLHHHLHLPRAAAAELAQDDEGRVSGRQCQGTHPYLNPLAFLAKASTPPISSFGPLIFAALFHLKGFIHILESKASSTGGLLFFQPHCPLQPTVFAALFLCCVAGVLLEPVQPQGECPRGAAAGRGHVRVRVHQFAHRGGQGGRRMNTRLV